MKDPEPYLKRELVHVSCPVQRGLVAPADSNLRVHVNHDIYFASSKGAKRMFEAEPLKYIGSLTDPVSGVRFEPTSSSPHTTYEGRDYYFATQATFTEFQAAPAKHAHRPKRYAQGQAHAHAHAH